MILSSARREKGGRDHRHLDASASRRFTLIVVQMRTPVEGLLGGGKTWEQIDSFKKKKIPEGRRISKQSKQM